MEGVEITSPDSSYVQQLEAAQYGGAPSEPLLLPQQFIISPIPGPCTVGFSSVLSDINNCTVGNASLRNNRFGAPEAWTCNAVVAVKMRLRKPFQESPDAVQTRKTSAEHPGRL